MFKKMKMCTIALSLSVAPAVVHAESLGHGFDVSANVGFVSDYSFRGVSQSDERPAVQGGFDISHETGLYAGVWGSNVDFNEGTGLDPAHLEIDVYGGYSGDFNGINYDLGVIYYAYPGVDDAQDYDFVEGSVAVGYDFDIIATSASVNYSPDFFGGVDDAWYYAAAIDVPLPYDVTLSAHVGHQAFDDSSQNDYTDWSIGLGYTLAGFDLSLQYVDTDLSESECSEGCDSRVIAGVSRSF